MGPWEITLTIFVISSTQAHAPERATHDTAQSSLPQHHPTSPASPYTHPELPKQSVAKSETFSSKSLACQSLAPYRTYSHQFARSQNNLSQNRRHLAQNLSHAATFFHPFGGKRCTTCGAFLLYLSVCRGKKRVSV